ncbi:hypothetical protein D3C80_1313350 [compost metagenome]
MLHTPAVLADKPRKLYIRSPEDEPHIPVFLVRTTRIRSDQRGPPAVMRNLTNSRDILEKSSAAYSLHLAPEGRWRYNRQTVDSVRKERSDRP